MQQQNIPPKNFGWPGGDQRSPMRQGGQGRQGRQGGQEGNLQGAGAAAPAARFHIQIPRVQQKKQQALQQPPRQQFPRQQPFHQQQQQRKSQQKRQQQQRKSQRQRQRQQQLRSQLQRQKQKQQQFVQRTQRQQQHKCPRTEKEYWNTVDESILDLTNSNVPIPTELAQSTRNTLVQEFGHTPQEAKYLVNLRMSNLVTHPSIQRSIRQPSQSVSWLQGGSDSKIGQSTRQQSCDCKRKEQKLRKSKKTTKKKSRMILGNNLILDSGAKYIYMNEFPEFQILFTKVAVQLLKTKIPKGKILTKRDASFIRKIIHKKSIPGYRDVNYPKEFRFRPTQETQMARRLAKHSDRKITSRMDYASAKKILKEL